MILYRKHYFYFILFIALYFVITTSVNAQGLQKVKIIGVAVKGNSSISENSIKVQSGLIEGKEISYDNVSDAVNNLWKLKIFSDIQIYLDKATDLGLFLIIDVKEYPRLGKVELRGNKKVSDTKINDEIYLLSGKVLSPHLISECKRKIKNLYKEDGFLLAEVSEELVDGEKENTQNLILNIKDNKRVRINDISFEGNEHFTDARLRRVFKKTKKRFLLLFRLGKYEENEFEEDKKLLKAFYRTEGYRDFTILSDTISYSEDKKRMQIKFTIQEGEKYKYRNITFSGNTLYTNEQISILFGLKPGDDYNQKEFDKGVYERINAAYMDRGYLFFQCNPLEVPVGKNEVDLELQITENYEVSVHQIHIVGNDKTHENVIRREMKIYPGNIFSREKLMRSQRELFVLNYFANVEPDVLPVSDKEVDLEFKVEEKSADRANLSVSISQLHGLIGGGGVEFNNFRGKGQQLKISYQQGANYSIYGSGSTPYKSMSFGFTDPWLFDTPNLVGASVFFSERGGSMYRYTPYDLNMYGASLRWGRRLRWPDNYFQASWSVNYARKKYENMDESYKLIYSRERTTGVSITQVIARNSIDKPEFPSRGSKLNWTTTFSGRVLGGTESYQKHRFTLDYYIPSFWKFVLYNHMEFGILSKIGKNGYIPIEERFIMGGAGMIYGTALRGYEDNSVGTRMGYFYGGQTLFKYTMEYRFSISENPTIYAHTFVEAGNTWTDLKSTDPFNLKRAAGFGVRLFMPQIGMIGVDFGYGFDDNQDIGAEGYGKPEGWKTHFIFGMPF